MKTHAKSHIDIVRRVDRRLAWALVVALVCYGETVRAEVGDAGRLLAGPPTGATSQLATPPSVSAAVAPVQTRAANQPSSEALSPLVTALVRMADAGVSTTVIVTFVECSSSADPLTDTEIIVLKKHNVADEVVTALMKQGAKSRALAAQRRNEAVASFVAARNARFNGLDPESYEYFQYYYLQPRALASVYQRLSPYYPPRGSYTYGPSSAFGFRNHFYGRPRY